MTTPDVDRPWNTERFRAEVQRSREGAYQNEGEEPRDVMTAFAFTLLRVVARMLGGGGG